MIRISRSDHRSRNTFTSPDWAAGRNSEGTLGSAPFMSFTPTRNDVERAGGTPAARGDDIYSRESTWGLSTSVTSLTDVDLAILMEGSLDREVSV